MTNSINLAETLDVQMKHLPRLRPLITLYRLFFFQRRKPGAAESAQGTEHSTATQAKA